MTSVVSFWPTHLFYNTHGHTVVYCDPGGYTVLLYPSFNICLYSWDIILTCHVICYHVTSVASFWLTHLFYNTRGHTIVYCDPGGYTVLLYPSFNICLYSWDIILTCHVTCYHVTSVASFWLTHLFYSTHGHTVVYCDTGGYMVQLNLSLQLGCQSRLHSEKKRLP